MAFDTSNPMIRDWLDWLEMDRDTAERLPKATVAMRTAIETAGAEHNLTPRQQAYVAIVAVSMMLADRPTPQEIDVLLDWAGRNLDAVRPKWLDTHRPGWRSEEMEAPDAV